MGRRKKNKYNALNVEKTEDLPPEEKQWEDKTDEALSADTQKIVEAYSDSEEQISEQEAPAVIIPKKKTRQCDYPGCTEEVLLDRWGCLGHWYKLPQGLRIEIKKQGYTEDLKSQVEAFVADLKSKEKPTKARIVGDGEPKIKLTDGEAKALLTLKEQTDVFNPGVAMELRRMQVKIPRSERLFIITKASFFSKDPMAKANPFFGAIATELGIKLATEALSDSN